MHVGSLQLVKVAQQVTVLLSNVASGIGVVFANKAVFTTAQFRFPVMLTAIHYAVNLVLLVILAAAGFVRWRTAASAERIHLVTAVWALHNGMSNLSLARNSVGLYQISKILVTPLICALERCLYNKVPPPRQAVALVGACAGVFLATVSDVQFTAVGAATALASAVASAVLKVLQQEVLQQHRWTSLELMYKTWAPQLALLLLSLPLLDPSSLTELEGYVWTSQRGLLLLLSAVAAFALNVSSLVTIQITSAIAIVLLGQTKMMLTLLGGFLFFDSAPAPRMLAGAALAIGSSAVYTYESLGQSQRHKVGGAAAPATSTEGDDDEDDYQASSSEVTEDEPLTMVRTTCTLRNEPR